MGRRWNFFTSDPEKTPNDLEKTPNCVRPETHWWQEQIKQGRKDFLWFSLQLSPQRAKQLCDAFAGPDRGDFGALIHAGAQMAPASYTALRFAIAAASPEFVDAAGPVPMDRMLGTDLLVPPAAYEALGKLAEAGAGILEITDAGLALDGMPNGLPYKSCRAGDPLVKELLGRRRPLSCVVKGSQPSSGPVIIAMIDDGIGIANDRFRDTAVTTRIRHFLDLSSPDAGGVVKATDELLAWSCTRGQIDDLLDQYKDCPDGEERIYRDLGLIDPAIDLRQPLRAAVSHGTHVLDTAAGYDRRKTLKKELDKRPIIAVQVPTQAGEDRSDAWMPLTMKRALDWILVKADALSAEISGEKDNKRRLPLIVNCSFASFAGPQDGWSDVERRIAQFVETYRGGGHERLCTVVMSAGNGLQFGAAARVKVEADKSKGSPTVSVPWRVLPDDKTPSFVQVWLEPLSRSETQRIEVALQPPNQETGTFSKLGKAVEWADGTVAYARLYHQRWIRPGDQQRECVTIAIWATDDDGEGKPVVPAGLWHIKIRGYGEVKQTLTVDLHVHRDDVTLFARRKGRQSYFDDPYYRPRVMAGDDVAADWVPPLPGHAHVTPNGTLNAYGYGKGTVLVAGYRRSDREAAAYSSRGAETILRKTHGLHGHPLAGPDLAAVTEESPSLPGILATGTYSGTVARLNGTSVAAPLAVRALAGAIAAGGAP